jgi:hypothetical protein
MNSTPKSNRTTPTPGPWKWVDGYLYEAAAWDRYSACMALPESDEKWDHADAFRPVPIVETDSGVYGPFGADRPLIAAAPDLLDALKGIVRRHGEGRGIDIPHALEVIAKAEGRS